MHKYLELFWAFIKPGVFGFGGGQATIPLIREEVVENYGWLTEEQFADYLTMGNTLPGPIATKMSIIIGYDLHGYLGAFIAFMGMILPSTIAILVLFNVFLEYKDTAFVQGMQAAAKPVVVVLIAGVALTMARSSFLKDINFGSTNTWIVFGLFVVALVLTLLNEFDVLDIHPALMIVVALLIGGFFIKL
jgi:chromate transporter